jgi:hypothetical protein
VLRVERPEAERDLTDGEFSALLRRRLEEREAECRREMEEGGRAFLGAGRGSPSGETNLGRGSPQFPAAEPPVPSSSPVFVRRSKGSYSITSTTSLSAVSPGPASQNEPGTGLLGKRL